MLIDLDSRDLKKGKINKMALTDLRLEEELFEETMQTIVDGCEDDRGYLHSFTIRKWDLNHKSISLQQFEKNKKAYIENINGYIAQMVYGLLRLDEMKKIIAKVKWEETTPPEEKKRILENEEKGNEKRTL